MYLEFYGLHEKPFSQTPDPRFLYWNDAYRETLASLSYGIRERKGFIAMLGEAGTGKTTLLRKLLDELGDDIVSVFLFNPNATFEEILEYTLSELGITAPSGRKLAMLQRLNEFLLAAYAEGRNTILLIDEAQDLDAEVLESLRLLSNLETSDDKILQIVLSGQPELAEKLAAPGLRQLKQRIAVRCRLEPLRFEELPSYLGARLEVAGGSPELFDPDTFAAIWEFASGIPRIINTVCDNALLLGYALGKRTIDAAVIDEVLADLRKLDVDEWLPASPPTLEPEAARPAPVQSTAPPAPDPVATVERPVPIPPAYGPPADPGPRARSPSGTLGWVIAAVLAAALLLLAGAWLGRSHSSSPRLAEPDPQDLPERRLGALAPSDAAAVAMAPPNQRPDTGPSAAAPRVATSLRDAPARRPEEEPGERRPVAPGPDTSGASAMLQGGPDEARRVSADRSSAAHVAGDVAQPRPVRPATPPADPAPADVVPLPPSAAGAPAGAPQAEADTPGDLATHAEAPAPKARDGTSPPTGGSAADVGSGEAGPAPAETAAPSPARAPERLASASGGRQTAPPPRPVAPSRQTAPPPRPVAPSRQTTQVPVAPGDTLLQMAARRYGTSNLTTLDMLRAVNPNIRDVDLIIAGSGLVFPDPGPASRILPDGAGYSVLALTTQTLSRALALQSALEDRLDRPVSLERVATLGSPNAFRVSVRGLSDRTAAAEIAGELGPIVSDPSP